MYEYNTLTIGVILKFLLSMSPCSKNSLVTSSATYKYNFIIFLKKYNNYNYVFKTILNIMNLRIVIVFWYPLSIKTKA